VAGDAVMHRCDIDGRKIAREIARLAQAAVADRVQPIRAAKADRASDIAAQWRAGKCAERVVARRRLERDQQIQVMSGVRAASRVAA
jgi:hypothetical protein